MRESGVGVPLYEQLLRDLLRRSVQVHGVDGLIRGQRNDALHAAINRGVNDVFGADNIRLDRFKRVVFASRHLLERSRMHHHVHSVKRAVESVFIPDITEKVAERGIADVGEHLPHVMLLQLIPAEHNEFLGSLFPQHDFHEFLAEGAGAPGDQHRCL